MDNPSLNTKSREKKLILISFIGVILLGTLCFLLLVLAGAFNRAIDIPVSYPNNPDNIVDIGDENKKDFQFGVITSDDTVELRNQMNEILIINLENREWKDLMWSPDNKRLAVLGESSENIFDIYVYDLYFKNWSKITTYNNLESGVTSYKWVSNEDIYFTQGEEGDSWIHTVNVNSQANSIVKIVRLDGIIDSISEDRNKLIIKNGLEFRVLNLTGEVILRFPDLNRAYFVNSDEVLYEFESGEKFITTIEDNDVRPLSKVEDNILCIAENIVTYRTEDMKVIFEIRETTSGNILSEINFDYSSDENVGVADSICYKPANFLVDLGDYWIQRDGDKMTIATYMSGVYKIVSKN